MLTKVLLILIPTLIYARINIDLKAGTNENNANIEFLGSNVEIIPDGERDAWRLSDSQLKDAVRDAFGRRPNDAYLKSPTPWGDLYKRYDWPQVQRILFPRNAKILGIKAEPVIITTQEFINNSSVKATYNAGITQQVEETVSSTWSKGGELQIGQSITYKVEFGAGEIGGTTSISYSASWGEATSKSKSVTVGSSSGVMVELQPGQEVIASLTATRGTMEVQVDYTAILDGVTACNYAKKYQGHHFWWYEINACLKAAKSPTRIDSTENIKIGFYSDAKVMVSDKRSRSKILEVDAVFFNNSSVQSK